MQPAKKNALMTEYVASNGRQKVPRAVGEVGVGDRQHQLHREPAGADAHDVGEDGEHRNHDQPGEHPRNDQVRRRRAAQALQRVDLLGDPHRAQLGGVARADPAGEDQRR